MGTLLKKTDWKKLLDLYFHIDVSQQFINCADAHLTPLFEKATGLQADGFIIRISWEPGEEFKYKKGAISSMQSRICLRYGQNRVSILWKSKSGRIYDIADTDIDCSDLEFSFEGLNPEQCQHYFNPKWSLITFPEAYIESLKFQKFAPIPSLEFISCADKQLTPFFENFVGIKVNKNVGISISMHSEAPDGYHVISQSLQLYQKDIVSKLAFTLYINHNWNQVFVLWKSKSGRIYDMADTDMDCNDIEFWFEGLDPLLYHKQLYPKAKLPFQIKNLSYQLVITRLNMDCTIEMELKEGDVKNTDDLIHKIDKFIVKFNEAPEKNEKNNGVVHNWQRQAEGIKIVYEIDTGFAGPVFLKKLLPFLSKMNCFLRVEIC